jgi:hypothetical protein
MCQWRVFILTSAIASIVRRMVGTSKKWREESINMPLLQRKTAVLLGLIIDFKVLANAPPGEARRVCN